mmetsp:Transcript_20849/g.35118  ORF Transcript_20849/g.35118 Transcript_20849/m.35118 type:complete len:108 (-) Transcript_20849:193-516(-)
MLHSRLLDTVTMTSHNKHDMLSHQELSHQDTAQCLRERVNQRRTHILRNFLIVVALQLEDSLYYGDLSGGCVITAKSSPVIDHKSSPDNITSAIHSACHEGHLQQGR